MKELREAASEFLVMAGKDDHGRRQFDPLFEAVTEHRQGKGYSSCGDLAHWLLYRLGFRFAWVNRKEHKGWRVGRNLSLLCSTGASGQNSVAALPSIGQDLDAGDVLVVNAHNPSKSHVVVVLAEVTLEHGATMRTAEYGQFDSDYGRASGCLSSRLVTIDQARKIHLGTSSLDSVLSLHHLAELDRDHVAADKPVEYYRRIGARQRALRRMRPTMRGSDVRWWQEELKAGGFDPGTVDEVFGSVSEVATIRFQQARALEPTGRVGPDDWCSMMAWSRDPRPQDEPQAWPRAEWPEETPTRG